MENDYREILKTELLAIKKTKSFCNFSFFAAKAGVSSSYLTRVMQKRAHLQMDHLFRILVHAEMSKEKLNNFMFLYLSQRTEEPMLAEMFTQLIQASQDPMISETSGIRNNNPNPIPTVRL